MLTACTVDPDSKVIFTTFPAISAETVTPCTAVMVPVAVMLVSQLSSRAVAAVTVSGGMTMAAPAAPITENWFNLVPTSAPTTRMMPTTVRAKVVIFLNMLVSD